MSYEETLNKQFKIWIINSIKGGCMDSHFDKVYYQKLFNSTRLPGRRGKIVNDAAQSINVNSSLITSLLRQ